MINEAINEINNTLAFASGKKDKKAVVKVAITKPNTVAKSRGFNSILMEINDCAKPLIF